MTQRMRMTELAQGLLLGTELNQCVDMQPAAATESFTTSLREPKNHRKNVPPSACTGAAE